MAEDQADRSFEMISERLARLTVTRSSGRFGLALDTRLRRHSLGLTEAPLYTVGQPVTPDDESWEITAAAAGAFVDQASEFSKRAEARASTLQTLDPLYTLWAAGSRARHGHEIIQLLPVGQYLLARSSRPILRAYRVLLGNVYVNAAPNMRVLREHEPYYASIIGPDAAAVPDLTQPLLSLVVLNYVAAAWMQGNIFFPFSAPGKDDPGPGRDLLLIIPVDGALIMDAMEFAGSEPARAKSAWKNRQALEFAEWCCDPYC